MKKRILWISIGLSSLIAIGVMFFMNKLPLQKSTDTATRVQQSTEQFEAKKQDIASAITEVLTRPQKNAVRSAKQYLSMQGFSHDGLIQQLSSDAGDGYEIADATVAVNSLSIDWNNEAVRSAKQYLTFQGFSCKGLIEQLSSSAGEKFTVSQATYGARLAGAC